MASVVTSEVYSVQLAQAAPVAELERWLASAGAGHRATYASGVDLPRGEPGVVLVRQWEERGLVVLRQDRDQDDARRWRWSAVRTDASLNGSFEPSCRAKPDNAETRAQLRSMLSTLRSCAESRRACPSDRVLARELGLGEGERGRQRAAYLLRTLARRGDVKVDGRGTCAPRVVTIVAAGRANGRSTAA